MSSGPIVLPHNTNQNYSLICRYVGNRSKRIYIYWIFSNVSLRCAAFSFTKIFSTAQRLTGEVCWAHLLSWDLERSRHQLGHTADSSTCLAPALSYWNTGLVSNKTFNLIQKFVRVIVNDVFNIKPLYFIEYTSNI